MAKPLVLWVPSKRVELPTRGFSVNHPDIPNLLKSYKLLK